MDSRTNEAAELEKELAENAAEISRIESELETLKAQWSSDAVDRRLAANRARVGDIGNALAHQGKIDSRAQQKAQRELTEMQWRWQGRMNDAAREKDENRQREADFKALENDIFTAEMAKTVATNENERRLLDWKIHRLRKDYKNLTGSDFDFGKAKDESGSDGTSFDEQKKYVEDNAPDGVWKSAEAKAVFGGWNPKTSDEVKYKKQQMDLPTKEEKAAWEKAVAEEKKEADRIAARYYGNIDAYFTKRWNAASPDNEIRLLKKYYEKENGYLKRKQ